MDPRAVVAIALVLSTGGFGAGWTAQGWRQSGVLNSERAEFNRERQVLAEQLAAANKRALEQTNALQKVADHAQENGIARMASAEVSVAGARTQLDRLRQQLATNERVSSATLNACRRDAAATRVLFSDCAGKYLEMARQAGERANDQRTLMDAWPRPQEKATSPLPAR